MALMVASPYRVAGGGAGSGAAGSGYFMGGNSDFSIKTFDFATESVSTYIGGAYYHTSASDSHAGLA